MNIVSLTPSIRCNKTNGNKLLKMPTISPIPSPLSFFRFLGVKNKGSLLEYLEKVQETAGS